MHVRYIFAALVVSGVVLSGCSLPRGPINIAPLVPRWLAHGQVSSDCPPVLPPPKGGVVDPAAMQPPVSKFHPVPTRPVFEPSLAPPSGADTGPRLSETRSQL